MEIRSLKRWEIADDNWNNSILLSPQGNVYALTWYLDAMTDGDWQGLILGNYDAVMPFYKKSKYLIPYITQPFLCQRLGIFSAKKQVDSLEIEKFYKKLGERVFKYDILTGYNIPLNSKHHLRENHILSLEYTYDELLNNYNRNTKRNLAVARGVQNHSVTEDVELMDFIAFLKQNDPTLLLERHSTKVIKLIKSAISQKNGYLLVAKENNELRAAAFFIVFGGRIYFLICASDERGKEIRSMYYLIDYVIRKNAKQAKVFDFTGSSIQSIAQRNLGFGAQVETYYHVSRVC